MSLWSINFDKGGRSIKWNKNSLFNKWCWGDLDGYMHENETQPPTYTIHTHTHKINSRWIKDLNISCETIKVLEENTGRKVSAIPYSSIFTDISPRARDIEERINKWDLIIKKEKLLHG